MNTNVKWVNDQDLCHGCGACEVICPHDAISMINTGKNNFPYINLNCTDCNLCNMVCSGQETSFDKNSLEIISQIRKETYYLFESKNTKIRSKGSSGGFITQYLIYLLQTKKIDGAIVAYSDGTMSGTKSIIAYTENEILSSIGSKYFPVSSCQALKDIDPSKKYAFVGKGCDIESLELLKDNDKKIKKSIYISIGLICHHTPHANETKKLIESNGFKIAAKASITYRNEGWPGQTIIQNKNNKVLLDYKVSWGKHLGVNIPFRCQICTQNFAPKADITVGDPWKMNPDLENRELGTSLILINTPNGKEKLFTDDIKEYFTINATDSSMLLESQKNLFKKLLNAQLKLNLISKLGRINIRVKNNVGILEFWKLISVRDIISSVKFVLKNIKRHNEY